MDKRDFLIEYITVTRDITEKENKIDNVCLGLTESFSLLYNDYMCWAEKSINFMLNDSHTAIEYFFESCFNTANSAEEVADRALFLSIN